MSELTMIVFLCPVVFLASLVDAIAGGGGLLSVPAYLMTGMPVHYVYGCNKFSCCTSTVISAARFFRHKSLHVKSAVIAGLATLVSSAVAAQIVLFLPEQTLKIMLLAAMPLIALMVFLYRAHQVENQVDLLTTTQLSVRCVCIGLIMGLYDGLLGPGSGTLAIILCTAFLKLDLKTASGNTKMLVLASTFSSLIAYILAGKVLWRVAIPVTVFGLLGSYIGAGLAIRKGARFIRPVMLLVASCMIVKMVGEMAGIF